MTARLLDVSPDVYHALPGLSPSTATTLIQRSPLHAMSSQGKVPTRAMDRGSVMHTMILGSGKGFAVLDYPDWRTDASKEARERARADGKIPILKHAYDDAAEAVIAIMCRMKALGVKLDGQSEAAIEWEEPSTSGPVLCRTMIDHLIIDRGEMLELKIVDDASPARMERSAESMGHAIACAARYRALAALRPDLAGRQRYRFLFCEAGTPYAVHNPEPDGVFREIGEQRWMRAVESWGRCEATGRWPGYEDHRYITAPQWALRNEGFTSND